MAPRNLLCRRRKDRPSQSSPSLFSCIAGFFNPLFRCFKNTNIVSPINENESSVTQIYSGCSIKAINGSVVEEISISSSCREDFGEERSNQSHSSEVRTCSKYLAEATVTEEEFEHPCIPQKTQDNAKTEPNYARVADNDNDNGKISQNKLLIKF